VDMRTETDVNAARTET